jgi:hypothetical protein
MFNDNYSILSLPKHNKHYVLRTASERDSNLTITIDDMKISATINAICDSYDDSLVVVENLTLEK